MTISWSPFYVPEPMRKPEPKKTSDSGGGLPKARGEETILVVEDEEYLRKLSAQILGSLGYRVVEAEDGLDALNVCDEYPERIDLVLSDVQMPQLKGPEFVHQLRSKRDDFKVLYISGFRRDSFTSAFEDAFHNKPREAEEELLPKPYTPQQLAEQVRTILDEDQLQAA